MRHHGARAVPARSLLHQASRAISRRCRPVVCRRLIDSKTAPVGSSSLVTFGSGNWTRTEAASGWPEASVVGYGSARGAAAAHCRSEGWVLALRGDATEAYDPTGADQADR